VAAAAAIMSGAAGPLWPWLAVAGLGVFHGVNPAMGWLFAVALGLHRHSRKVVFLCWVPIAVGHAVAVAVVLFVVLGLGLAVDHTALGRAAGAALIGWATWHAVRGHRRRLRIGMQTGLAGLAVWSFLMSSAHGAGFMLIPVILPLCGQLTRHSATPLGAAALGLHTAAMLATITAVSLIVYDRVGLDILRTSWINFDLIWIAALATCGLFLLLTGYP
jgi:hypothetical protein